MSSQEIVDNSKGEVIASKQELEFKIIQPDFKFPQDCFKYFDTWMDTQNKQLVNRNIGVLKNIDATDGLCKLTMASDIKSIISETKNNNYVLDFDNLPQEVKEKLKKRIYKLGESRQVDGNLRAVVVDETGQKVKEITVKLASGNISGIINNALSSALLKKIYAQVLCIKESVNYQIDLTRDQIIKAPFESILMDIFEIQNQDKENIDVRIIDRIIDKLKTLIGNVKTAFDTDINKFISIKRFKPETAEKYGKYLAEDLQFLTFYVAVLIRIDDFMGNQNGKAIIEKYIKNTTDKVLLKNQKGWSVIEILQDYYPYNSDNKDSWYNLLNCIEMPNTIKLMLVESD